MKELCETISKNILLNTYVYMRIKIKQICSNSEVITDTGWTLINLLF